MTEDMIGVLYNDCYGGFSMSKKAIDLYNMKMLELNPDHKNILYNQPLYSINRNDKILIDVYNQLGNDFNGERYTKIKAKYINKKYENCYNITEYDGLEGVEIDVNKYKIETIKNIIKNNISSDEKINQINLLFANDL